MELWWDVVNTVLNILNRLEKTTDNLELSPTESVTYFVIAFI
jgi:hypothetical protein